MRFTIDRSLTDTEDVDLFAAPGVPLGEALDGHTRKRAWCGPTLLEHSHPIGTFPLVEGARLRDRPGPRTCPPSGFSLAAIAGPDAGVVIDVDDAVDVGSAPGRHRLGDDAVDPVHLSAIPVPGRGIACTDASSTNGTGWWRHDGDRWLWSGRKRRFTARPGDILTLGASALQVRHSGDDVPSTLTTRLGLSATRLLASLPWAPTPSWLHLPDPTAPSAWTGNVHITGPHAREAARAVVLARGRRPPAPSPIDEDWLRWLPDSLASDGAIRLEPAPHNGADVHIEAHAHHTRLHSGLGEFALLPLAVSQATADVLARTVASTAPLRLPTMVRWADVDQDTAGSQAPGLSTALGVVCSDERKPWIITLDASNRHLLAAGARGAGNSTLLATLVSGLAFRYDATRLSIVIVGRGTQGPLAPCARLPHVADSTVNAGGDQSLRILRAAVTQMHRRRERLRDCGAPDWHTWEQSTQAPGRLLVVIDDVDEAVGQSRAAAAAIEALATSPEFVGIHLALATHRPAGAITPGLRASCSHTVALRAASEADSLGVIGVPDAAMLEPFPGRAIVRRGGTRVPVHVALPLADRSPRVRGADSDAAAGRQLLDVIAARTHQEGSAAPEPSPWSL